MSGAGDPSGGVVGVQVEKHAFAVSAPAQIIPCRNCPQEVGFGREAAFEGRTARIGVPIRIRSSAPIDASSRAFRLCQCQVPCS